MGKANAYDGRGGWQRSNVKRLSPVATEVWRADHQNLTTGKTPLFALGCPEM